MWMNFSRLARRSSCIDTANALSLTDGGEVFQEINGFFRVAEVIWQ
jgi:hypothetical protein